MKNINEIHDAFLNENPENPLLGVIHQAIGFIETETFSEIFILTLGCDQNYEIFHKLLEEFDRSDVITSYKENNDKITMYTKKQNYIHICSHFVYKQKIRFKVSEYINKQIILFWFNNNINSLNQSADSLFMSFFEKSICEIKGDVEEMNNSIEFMIEIEEDLKSNDIPDLSILY